MTHDSSRPDGARPLHHATTKDDDPLLEVRQEAHRLRAEAAARGETLPFGRALENASRATAKIGWHNLRARHARPERRTLSIGGGTTTAASLDDLRALLGERPISLTAQGGEAPFADLGLLDAGMTVLSGPPGSGKTTIIMAAVLDAVLQRDDGRLPGITLISAHPCFKGLADLLREMIPTGRRDVLSIRLSNSVESSVNVFDTAPGMRLPEAADHAFLTEFVCSLPSLDAGPGSSLSRMGRGRFLHLAHKAISDLYSFRSDEGCPRAFQPGAEPSVDAALSRIGANLARSGHLSWWGVTDRLLEAGLRNEAMRAQRHAVPTLDDLVRLLSSPPRAGADDDIGEDERAYLRQMADVLRQMLLDRPMLSGPTRVARKRAGMVFVDLADAWRFGMDELTRGHNAMVLMAVSRAFGADALSGPGRDCGSDHGARHVLVYDEIDRVLGSGPFLSFLGRLVGTARSRDLGIILSSQDARPLPDNIPVARLVACGERSAAIIAASGLRERYEGGMFRRENGRFGVPIVVVRGQDGQLKHSEAIMDLSDITGWALTTRPLDASLREAACSAAASAGA